MADLKTIATTTIDACKEELQQLSGEIWKHPELNFQEHIAHDLLTSFLEKKGFVVDRGYTGIGTAFRATFGSGRPNVCVVCEYDALPEIGHACGHNLIAEAGVAAGLGVKAALEASGTPRGTVTVMGTPAEEGGGKVFLIENGAFADVDIAMMIHPAPYSIIMPNFAALQCYTVTFTGKAAHAASFPWEGVNALDAAVMAYNSIAVLRQQMKPDWRVNINISSGGARPSIIPDHATINFWVRAFVKREVEILASKVKDCCAAAALATGCQYDIKTTDKPFDNLLSNQVLAELFEKNLAAQGIVDWVETVKEAGSTDMGNVSYVVPSIHPMYKIGSGESYHTLPFTSVSNTLDTHKTTLLWAEAMAHTGIDILTNSSQLKEAQSELEAANK